MGGIMRTHKVLLSEGQIRRQVHKIAKRICVDFRGKDLVLVGVLKGAFVFLTDLAREIERLSLYDEGVQSCRIEFMSISSYGESRKPGDMRIELDVRCSLNDCNVILIEDVADSLETLHRVRQILLERHPRELRICVLLQKPDCHKRTDVPLHYVCFSIENAGFVFGYGMDEQEKSRGLPYIAVAQ